MFTTISKGAKWPDEGRAPLGSVVILSAEDDDNDTIGPRLIAAGANLKKVHIVRSMVKDEDGSEHFFELKGDLDKLALVIEKLGDVVLVIIDPITSYLGTQIDSHRVTSVRGVMSPLEKWAKDNDVSVIGIAHPPKDPKGKATNAVSGSKAFIDVPRLSLIAVNDPYDKDRFLFLGVTNNIGAVAKGIGYRKKVEIVNGDDEDEIETSRIEWDKIPVEISANEALALANENERNSPRADAKAFLREHLITPILSKELDKLATKCGISERTLNRARKELGVQSRKNKDGKWETYME